MGLEHIVMILEVLRQRPGASRAELAELSGLSPATISRVVAKLRRDGLVDERVAGRPGNGRPPKVVELRADATHVLGIDAGGSRLRVVLTDLEGTVRASATTHVRATRDRASIVAAIASLVHEVRAGAPRPRVSAAAAGISGIVEPVSGSVLLSPDLPGLEGESVAASLERALGTPVAIDNDDMLAAVGEASYGAARGCSDVVFLSLGLGLGAGIIVGGRPLRGARSSAGAIAYLAPGRLEDRASGRVIPLRYLARETSAGRARTKAKDAKDAQEVFRRAGAGDAVAAAIVEETIDALGELAVNAAALLDPQVIVLGGGLARSGATLLEPLAERLRNAVPYPPQLAASQLGDEAVARGAAVLALTLAKQRLAARYGMPAVQPEPARIGALELV